MFSSQLTNWSSLATTFWVELINGPLKLICVLRTEQLVINRGPVYLVYGLMLFQNFYQITQKQTIYFAHYEECSFLKISDNTLKHKQIFLPIILAKWHFLNMSNNTPRYKQLNKKIFSLIMPADLINFWLYIQA